MLSKVVEVAIVKLGLAMLGAEDVAALASNLDNANFLCTVPAPVSISLYQVSSKVSN